MSGNAAAFDPTVEHLGPPPTPDTPTILVGIDGSDTAMRATAYAFGMAHRQHHHLIAHYVATHPALTALGPATTLAHDTTRQLHHQLRHHLHTTATELAVPVTYLTTYGDPHTHLRDTADHHHVNTVIVGASTSAGHRIAGSVATKLIRTGHWPVLVVP